MSQYEKLWDRVWRTSDQQDIRFQKAATYDIDGYVIGRLVGDNTVYVVAQLTGMLLGNVSYADGKSVGDTAAFNANWTILTWTINEASSIWNLSFALDWQQFIQSIATDLNLFLYVMRGSTVAVVNTDNNVQYYQVDTQTIVQDYFYEVEFPAVFHYVYCKQWYKSGDGAALPDRENIFTIEQSDNATFYLLQADGNRLTLGWVSVPVLAYDPTVKDFLPIPFQIPALPENPIALTSIQLFNNNDIQLMAPEYPLVRIGMVGDPNEDKAIGTREDKSTYPINFNGRTSNLNTVCLQVMSLSQKTAGMFLDMFPRYKKMCCAGPIDQSSQGLLCGQYTVDGGPGNNANCDTFMSQEWCKGDQLNQPECACQDLATITDEIDNDIFTALDGSRPKRCVVGACQRAYIPSDTMNRTCTPLCVQVAKATADCGGTIRYTVQQSMDCGNPNN